MEVFCRNKYGNLSSFDVESEADLPDGLIVLSKDEFDRLSAEHEAAEKKIFDDIDKADQAERKVRKDKAVKELMSTGLSREAATFLASGK